MLGCDTEEDIKKQVHTAKRIYDRLLEEKHFTSGESTVYGIVAALREKQQKVFVPLSFEPGEAKRVPRRLIFDYAAEMIIDDAHRKGA